MKIEQSSKEYIKQNIVFDRKCNKCGTLVLEGQTNGYRYQCVICDEDLYKFETTEISCDDEKCVNDVLVIYENVVNLLERD